jgi:hypothetical protein
MPHVTDLFYLERLEFLIETGALEVVKDAPEFLNVQIVSAKAKWFDAAFRRRGAPAGLVCGKRGKQSQIRQADIVNSKRLGSVLTMAREA